MKLTGVDINKWSFAQMTSNSDGKTSSSGTMGVYVIVLSMIGFLFGCVEFHFSGKADIMMYSSANVLVGAGLLGYRKSKAENIIPTELPKEEKLADEV